MTVIYPSLRAAQDAVPERARAFCGNVLPIHPTALTTRLAAEPVTLKVFSLKAAGIVGRDYREGGCILPDWRRELHEGRGGEQAWREIRHQRDTEDVEGALLPSPTPGGEMFLFVSASERIREQELVESVRWWDTDVRRSA
jgi:hypothetical protein